MEKIIVLALIFASFGLLIRRVMNLLNGKDSCSDCVNYTKCLKGKKICKVKK
jgi:hypothetical protein